MKIIIRDAVRSFSVLIAEAAAYTKTLHHPQAVKSISENSTSFSLVSLFGFIFHKWNLSCRKRNIARQAWPVKASVRTVEHRSANAM